MNKLAIGILMAAVMAVSGCVVVLSEDSEVSAVSAGTQDAIQAAFDSNQSVTLTSNITITSRLVVSEGMDVTLDFNGYTISMQTSGDAIMLNVFGNITLRDSSSSGTGGMTTNQDVVLVAVRETSVTTIESGTYSRSVAGDTRYFLQNEGTLNIEGGSFSLDQAGGDSAGTGIIGSFSNTIDTPTTVLITGGTFRSTSYAFALIGNGNPDDADNVVLTVEDADVEARICFSTNASSGDCAGCTINVRGGTFTGDHGMYLAGYGVFNLSGGTITGRVCGIQIASGELNITDDAQIQCDVPAGYHSLTGNETSGPGDVSGALVIGKANQYYVYDVDVNILGGTIINNDPDGDAIVLCDTALGTSGASGRPVGEMSVNAQGGKVSGNVTFTTTEGASGTGAAIRVSDSSKITMSLDGATVDGDIAMPTEFQSKVDIVSGVVTGDVPANVTVPASSGTVTYSWTGESYTYFGGSFSISADAPVREGSTLEGYRVTGSSAVYQMGDRVSASGSVTVTPVWSSNVPPIIFDDDEDEESVVGGTTASEGKDDTVTVVACAAAAVVAALMAAFLILDRRP